MEVEHVKAHRTKKEKEKMTQFEMFVTEGNGKADGLAEAGAMLDEGFMAGARAKTMQQEREEVKMALQYAASFHCLAERWKDCEELRPKPRETWIFFCAKEEREYETPNIVVCGSGQISVYEMWKRMQTHKDARKMYRIKLLVKRFGKWRGRHLGGHDLVRRIDRQVRHEPRAKQVCHVPVADGRSWVL